METLTVWRAAVLGVAVLLLGGALGFLARGQLEDERPGADSVDVGFLYDMIGHHQQALEMANVEDVDGAEGLVKVFAREILRQQAYEIGLMERRLADWGHDPRDFPATAMAWMGEPVASDAMPGLATDAEMDAFLDAEGPTLDALFVQLMGDHHRGGVHMAEHAAEHAGDPWVRDLAAAMARNQRAEINEMEGVRARLGLPPDPPGYVPDDIPDTHPDTEDEEHHG